MDEGEGKEDKPWRRRLLFIPGFDPRNPVAYHAMWKEDAPRQRDISGAEVTVDPRPARHPLGLEWTVRTGIGGRSAETRVTLLRWDDLVRKWWLRGDLRVLRGVPGWATRVARSGIYRLTRKGARPMWLSLITPPAFLVVMAGLTMLMAVAAALISPWAAIAVLVAAPWAILWAWRRLDARMNCGWVSQCFSYAVRTNATPPPEQVERCQAFADMLIAATDDPETDEVVLAGFSLGCNQAIRVLALALAARPDLGRGRVAVNLLTLGQSLNIYAMLPGDPAFRDGLKRVAGNRAIGWVDATSASDPATACTLHPLTGVVAAPGPERPERRPPRFHKLLTPERFRAIRRDPLTFHFQYLRSVDQTGGYDWFLMASGPDPLTRREAVQ